MTKAEKKKDERGRVSVYLDPATLKRLDLIVKRIPEIDSRSAAIRYAVRIAVKPLEEPS